MLNSCVAPTQARLECYSQALYSDLLPYPMSPTEPTQPLEPTHTRPNLTGSTCGNAVAEGKYY